MSATHTPPGNDCPCGGKGGDGCPEMTRTDPPVPELPTPEQWQEVLKFIAQRDEFMTALRNAAPDNAADYWRWMGGATARRELAQSLGLPFPGGWL